ncbi:Hypothetical protein NTJ_05994 [Nesidiocoris tenuis]|uniref:Uncharacterized protein n=1 Tax=Nesidiocoris tenuis TaxID=355587 RepID=A0ABN7AP31_9HEMI|nr:Hypothetical protein NTJ_05994 [Nesidiocoris tenuis]
MAGKMKQSYASAKYGATDTVILMAMVRNSSMKSSNRKRQWKAFLTGRKTIQRVGDRKKISSALLADRCSAKRQTGQQTDADTGRPWKVT